MPDGQEMQGGPASGGELIDGVMQATQVILEGVTSAPGVPDEAKQALAQATQQYITVLNQVVGGAAQEQGQSQPRQVESVPGGRPITPSGM